MPLHARKHSAAGPHRGSPDHHRFRLFALVGVVVCAVVLPFAVASAGPPGGGEGEGLRAVRLLPQGDERADGAPGDGGGGPVPGRIDGKPADRIAGGPLPAEPARSPLGLGSATAVRCGPELTSPGGIEAQTCVVTQAARTWARTYYRNATGEPLESVLSLMAPDGRSVRMRCAVGAEDEPGTCETPRERTTGEPAAYDAVAEFASRAGYGPLLLRAGSNLPAEADS
ncbi:hypothetical protein GCM10010377_14480 [Streptomyces viridiviolaceus]|uniref:Uncharacterized protein n=1 Tax=Streptomyces viridiviolaceus TaxID=68282 RepID=A0ABW2E096_9ACTN|nr:hypothetical protein [Streptomyces viridiviolaceus]GHB25569.1 hypothetical protein GCM10010377_14480 [Streptomyces viridiviolaceus]